MPNDEDFEDETGGALHAGDAPRSISRLIRGVVVLALAGLAAVVAIALLARLPSGTDTGSLAFRGGVGFGIGLAIVLVVRRMLRALVAPPPPLPDTVDARPADVVYECPVCGTRVRLEVAATAKAPKHCGEEMEARVAGR